VTGAARDTSPSSVNHVVCHCDGCHTYAHVLGRATAVLDQRGGTELFQMSPRQLVIETGREQLACMRLTEKGALRWYTKCCRTPIAHTLDSKRNPFMAVNHACVDWETAWHPRDRVLGPIRARVNGRFGRGQASALRAGPMALASMLLHYVPMYTWWFLRGDAKHSPFVDSATGELIAPIERVRTPMLQEHEAGSASAPTPEQRELVRGCG
jgi:hypothetical protein